MLVDGVSARHLIGLAMIDVVDLFHPDRNDAGCSEGLLNRAVEVIHGDVERQLLLEHPKRDHRKWRPFRPP